jgi:hypothetical protein
MISFAGVDGGFDNNEPEYEETHNIIILPDYVTLPFPSVELPEKVLVAWVFFFFFVKKNFHLKQDYDLVTNNVKCCRSG